MKLRVDAVGIASRPPWGLVFALLRLDALAGVVSRPAKSSEAAPNDDGANGDRTRLARFSSERAPVVLARAATIRRAARTEEAQCRYGFALLSPGFVSAHIA